MWYRLARRQRFFGRYESIQVSVISSGSAPSLRGEARVPGDKSISHRALMIGAVAVGETVIDGLLEGEDVLRTAVALRAMGAEIERRQEGSWRVHGVGIGGLAQPDDVLDMGNSGTGARLLMGLCASHPITVHFTGDASLRGRPMGRVITPLQRIGAQIIAREGGRLPLTLMGATHPLATTYRLPVASAQVKSALLFAGLNIAGTTTVIEPEPTRDHSEIMLRHFGVDLRRDDGGVLTLTGQPEISGRTVRVPGDPSSAAFPLVAALLCPDSEIHLPEVGVNPLRAGLFETLREMGADIELTNRRDQNGEPVADLTARSSALSGIEVPAERAPAMIDEYPILAVAAAYAQGTTILRGLGELRVKESDRLDAIAQGLSACGVTVVETADSLTITGCGGPPPGAARIASRLDHRIAMSFLVLGMAAKAPVEIDDDASIATSFPGFVDLMNGLGARLAATVA